MRTTGRSRIGWMMALVALAGALPVLAAKTWTGSVSTNWADAGNWDGGLPGNADDVVITNTTTKPYMLAGSYPASGAFNSFSISNGATVTCLGNTGVVNEASGGTVAIPHGIGVTIYAANATISGTLTAVGKGFLKGPGYNNNLGSAHGGRGYGNGGTYGSVTNPTALGSGRDPNTTGGGGGAIRLVVTDALSVNGLIDVSAPTDSYTGSGGSLWLTASNLTGGGTIKANGGDANNGPGGGGRIALYYTNSAFTGVISAAGGKVGQVRAQPGTLWDEKRFAGMAGTPASPVTLTITSDYQYYFPNTTTTNYWNLTVSNAWFEAHRGSVCLSDLLVTNRGVFAADQYFKFQQGLSDMTYLDVTNRIQVTGTSTVYLLAQTYTLASDLTVGAGSVLWARGDTGVVNAASGGIAGNPHGIGVAISAPNATIAGTFSAVGQGFPLTKGPGYSTYGAAHGGKSANGVALTYGSLTQPTALGSSGNQGNGGGAIRLTIASILAVNGAIDASADNGQYCPAGGSIWLTVSNLTGNGVIKAGGAPKNVSDSSPGGGGRIALYYTNSTFTGSVSVEGGRSGTTLSGQAGTLWDEKRFAGITGSPSSFATVMITNSYQYYFPNATTTNYWNLTMSNAWFEPHQGSLRIGDLTLTNGVFAFDQYAKGNPSSNDMTYLDITNRIQMTGSSTVYLVAQTYALASNLYVGTGSVLFARCDTGAVNAASGGTTGSRHGIGVTITASDATINGAISAKTLPYSIGPGYGVYGSGYGGMGYDAASKTYGSLAQPTALGSSRSASTGGGAIRLTVAGTLTVNGAIDAVAEINSFYGGSGGSIWLTALTLAGGGSIKANGCDSSVNPSGPGGGGRIALCQANNLFTGLVAVAPGVGVGAGAGRSGQTGTLFRCTSPVPDCTSPERVGPRVWSDFSVASNGVMVTRVVTTWNKSFQWTDTSRDAASNALNNTARYTLSGLSPGTSYSVYTNGGLMIAKTNGAEGGVITLSSLALTPSMEVRVSPASTGTMIMVR